MATFLQADRVMTITTPLGPDDLLLVGFEGREAISKLFVFHVDLIAENATKVPFEKLLGQKVTLHLTLEDGKKQRHFSGICSRISQGVRGNTFTSYTMEVVPQLWFLTRRVRSRIFQHIDVPTILKKVFEGLDVDYKITGKYFNRDYCVQYRESDFHFASRLMEEEGIFYFFTHANNGHTLVVADNPLTHPDVPIQSGATYDGSDVGVHGENRITSWEKSQEVRSGKYTLWDHCFELPHKHLEQTKPVADSVAVGQVEHKLKIGQNDKLERYDFPAAVAQRFDGVAPGGGDRAGDLQHIPEDGARTVAVRMQEETMAGLVIEGASTCRQFVGGHAFALDKHFNANGKYLLTSISHSGRFSMSNFLPGEGSEEYVYQNTFTCIPIDLPFRPARVTPKPSVLGTQTAVVVGPSGEEIFTDKYGRVKVQFHWDREGKNDANSSCWIRVGTPWAGKNWGMIHIPRIGQEVIVDFLEGDLDRPIIVGSVYNADMMPPYALPAHKTQSGIKSRSTLKGTPENFNELRFEDLSGSEQVYFHAERNFDRVVENNDTLIVGSSNGKTSPDGSQTITIYNNRTETVQTGNETVTIAKGNRTVSVYGNESLTVKTGNRDATISMGNDTLTIKMGNQTTKINLGKSETEALQSIELKVGQSSIKLDQAGVTIKGMMIKVEGQVMTQVKAPMTQVTADGILTLKGGVTMIG